MKNPENFRAGDRSATHSHLNQTHLSVRLNDVKNTRVRFRVALGRDLNGQCRAHPMSATTMVASDALFSLRNKLRAFAEKIEQESYGRR